MSVCEPPLSERDGLARRKDRDFPLFLLLVDALGGVILQIVLREDLKDIC